MKTGLVEQLSNNEFISANEKRHRLARQVEKGQLDHYSAFKIRVEEVYSKFTKTQRNDNIMIVVGNDGIADFCSEEFSFVKPINRVTVRLEGVKSQDVKVTMYDDKDSLIDECQKKMFNYSTVNFSSENGTNFTKIKVETCDPLSISCKKNTIIITSEKSAADATKK